MGLESLRGGGHGSGMVEPAWIPPLGSPRQHDQELEVSLECVEKPCFAIETETKQQQQNRQEENRSMGVPVRGRGQMPSKGSTAHALSSCHLVTVDLGLWWLGGRCPLKSDSG